MIKTGELNIYSTKDNLAQNSTVSSDFDIECDDKIIENSSITEGAGYFWHLPFNINKNLLTSKIIGQITNDLNA